jgi:hypothetical protein
MTRSLVSSRRSRRISVGSASASDNPKSVVLGNQGSDEKAAPKPKGDDAAKPAQT